VGELDQDARAVPGARVGTRRATVLEVVERRQRPVDDVVKRHAVEARDRGDSAAVVFGRWVIEAIPAPVGRPRLRRELTHRP
jgi:hypothetical protein